MRGGGAGKASGNYCRLDDSMVETFNYTFGKKYISNGGLYSDSMRTEDRWPSRPVVDL